MTNDKPVIMARVFCFCINMQGVMLVCHPHCSDADESFYPLCFAALPRYMRLLGWHEFLWAVTALLIAYSGAPEKWHRNPFE